MGNVDTEGDTIDTGMQTEIRKFLTDEFKIWTGRSIKTVEGYDDDETTAAQMEDVLAQTIALTLNQLGQRHHHLTHVTHANDQGLPMRRHQLCLEAERLENSQVLKLARVGRAIKCASLEVRKVLDIVLRDVADIGVRMLVDKQKRMNRWNSGPLLRALGLGGPFFGFGRQCNDLFQTNVTVDSICKRIDKMRDMTIRSGTTISGATATLVDTYHGISKDEQIFPAHVRPLGSALTQKSICMFDMWRRMVIRSQTTDAYPTSDFIIITQGIESAVTSMNAIRDLNCKDLDEYTALVDGLICESARQIDNDIEQQKSTRIFPDDDTSDDDRPRRRDRRHRDKDDRSSKTSTTYSKKASQGSKARRSARRRATSPNGDYAALFQDSGGRLCAYCNYTTAGRLTDGRKEVPHSVKNCATKLFDKIHNQFGANATVEYRKHAQDQGIKKVTEPSNRTEKIPSGTPCAVTISEIASALRDVKMPSSTKYTPPGSPGTSNDPNKALLSRLASLETAAKNDRDDMESRIKAAEERAMLAEEAAKKYRKRVKKHSKAANDSRRRPGWDDDSGEDSDESSSSSESDSE